MKSNVTAFISKHQLLTTGATVLVGVSGGPDSMALLHFLRSIQKEWELRLIAISIDHKLRDMESKSDLDYVRDSCDKWDIPFVGMSLDVPAYKQDKRMGTQIAAREMRYRFFAAQMEKYGADYLALGHHGDDQVETMVMGLVRSANSSDFSGIPVKRDFATGSIIRPLLGVTKEEINAYLEAYEIIPRVDPTNNETVYTRNFFRKKAIPLLKEKNSNIHTTVQHLSETLGEDEQFLRREAKKAFKEIVELDVGGRQASFEIDVFQAQHSALQRRIFHLILNYLYDRLPKDLSYVHEEQFFALLQSDKGNVPIDFPAHLKLEKVYGKLMFYFLTQEKLHHPSYHKILEVPGRIDFPDGSTVSALYNNTYEEDHQYSYFCNIEEIALPLHIRTRSAGDRMRWSGLEGSKKVKDIFIDAKIPKKDRAAWPILTDNNGEILWLIGLKKGQPEQKKSNTSYIQIIYEKGDM
ncbi:tRNA lysidine(34) synthetase TilS [Virgibacillus sp. NKC19-3]|uniref:tRNA lysidine(34) synthetase TilS n=1 Tax=Virgibacillus saliphilus TaxID=2831674 RepID=UPI001C9B5F59|nr:tRNA lysidine(34) synthetase TilS [Virgibacillus sp. NKC19-3]MBY7141643.1 tRNA lysidine(34) synthetase TilS [Virgibacillus sp. NKC19-3]